MKYSATVSKFAGCTGRSMPLKNEEKCGNLFTEEMKGIDKMAVLGIMFLGDGDRLPKQ